MEKENASKKEIKAYQDRQIAKLIRHAFETVPYYQRIMKERGLSPNDFTSRDSLVKLPILRKEDVIASRQELVSNKYNRKTLKPAKTSGTTGKALNFYTTKEAVAFQWAVWWRHRARFGISPFSWHLNFTVKVTAPLLQNNPPYWRWNWPMRQALLNMQHLTQSKIHSIAEFANTHDFKYYSGAPSIIARFTELLDSNNINLVNKPEVIFVGAENVQPFQRKVIEKITGATVTDQYGFSEGCGNASRCKCGSYHEDWEFGILECVDKVRLKDGSIQGKIVATGFANYAFPFIRYEVGDTATWEPVSFQCECGRSSIVIREINGRNEDYILTPEGNKIMRFAYLFKDTDWISEAQILQRELGSIVIRFVPRTANFSVDHEKLIRKKIHECVSPSLRIDFEKVDEIPRSKSGKFRAVVSDIVQKSNT